MSDDFDDQDDDDEYEPAEADSEPDSEGIHEAHGFQWESSRDYAEFMADFLGYDHDEIDFWLGYNDD